MRSWSKLEAIRRISSTARSRLKKATLPAPTSSIHFFMAEPMSVSKSSIDARLVGKRSISTWWS